MELDRPIYDISKVRDKKREDPPKNINKDSKDICSENKDNGNLLNTDTSSKSSINFEQNIPSSKEKINNESNSKITFQIPIIFNYKCFKIFF